MKKNSLQSYKVQYRLKTELKTMNQILISPPRMSSLVVVHCTTMIVCVYPLHNSCCESCTERNVPSHCRSRFLHM